MTHADAIAAMVDELRRGPPGSAATRLILADALDEAGPSPVERGRLPGWMRLCWLRLAPPRLRQRWAGTSASQVAQEIDEALGWPAWDHWGRAEVAGLQCLVSEPYVTPAQAAEVCRPLAELLPCCAYAFSRQGAWAAGTTRAILLPPLVMPAPRRR